MGDRGTAPGSGFPPLTFEDWTAQVAREGGAPRERRTEDQITLPPLACSGDFLVVPGRSTAAVERYSQVDLAGTPDVAGAIAHELDRGATGVLVEVGASASPDWAALLSAIQPVGTLHLRSIDQPRVHAQAWLDADLGGRTGCDLGLDPFTMASASGGFDDLPDELAASAALAAAAVGHQRRPRAFALDTHRASMAGATTAQSIGYLVAALVETLRALESAGIDPDRASGSIGLCLRVGPRFFEQLAALRALRLLHTQVLRSSGVDRPAPLHLTAMTEERALSVRDPWVNLLRQTAVGFAGLTGGADAVAVLPFDARLVADADPGRRIARNTTLILDEEAHLARVADPAAGSWFLDGLTRDLARAGWEFFQAIEREGGLVAAMQSGWILDALSREADARAGRIARREMPRTGVTEFANLAEAEPAIRDGRSEGWPQRHLDDDFESLRAAAERSEGQRPVVFLACIPDQAAAAPRRDWLAQLAAVAGIETVSGDPQAGLAQAFAASGATVTILAGPDDALAAEGPAAAQALARHGTVWAAGPDQPELAAAGAGRFVRRGMDMADLLRELLAASGVQS